MSAAAAGNWEVNLSCKSASRTKEAGDGVTAGPCTGAASIDFSLSAGRRGLQAVGGRG